MTVLESGETAAPAPDRPRIRGWPRVLWRVCRFVFLVYLGVLAVLYALQTRLVFPGSASQGTPESIVRARPGSELVALTTARGDRVVALFGPALAADGSPRPNAPRCPTLLFFYGNGMCLSASDGLFETFRRLGVNVLIPEYVGYGMSGGSPGEAACYATADAAYDHLMARADVDHDRVVASGWSLGGAVAVDLAVRRKVAGLAVFSTFTSLPDMARRAFPFLPTSALLRSRFDSLAKIARVTCPVLIGHGRDDRIIPHEMSRRLADAVKAPVTRYAVAGADHNDFFEAGGKATATCLRAFLDPLRATSQPGGAGRAAQ